MYKKNMEKYALVFLGATKTKCPDTKTKCSDPKTKSNDTKTECPDSDRCLVWGSARELYDKMPADLTYRVDKMFIHPLLGSDEVPPTPYTPPSKNHLMNPDMALARLAKAVPHFTDQVTPYPSFLPQIRPICLARPGGEERPICPDSSMDRSGWGGREPWQSWVHMRIRAMPPGRAGLCWAGAPPLLAGDTGAAWRGHSSRAEYNYNNGRPACSTDHSDISLEKSRWPVAGLPSQPLPGPLDREGKGRGLLH